MGFQCQCEESGEDALSSRLPPGVGWIWNSNLLQCRHSPHSPSDNWAKSSLLLMLDLRGIKKQDSPRRENFRGRERKKIKIPPSGRSAHFLSIVFHICTTRHLKVSDCDDRYGLSFSCLCTSTQSMGKTTLSTCDHYLDDICTDGVVHQRNVFRKVLAIFGVQFKKEERKGIISTINILPVADRWNFTVTGTRLCRLVILSWQAVVVFRPRHSSPP